MANKPFTPKLGSARPRLSAALTTPNLLPYTPPNPTQATKLPKKLGTHPQPKGKIAAALLALKGQF